MQNRWFSPSGEVSVADVRFLAEAAPQELLMPGVRFELLEGERVVAIGMLVAAQRTLDEIGKLAEAI